MGHGAGPVILFVLFAAVAAVAIVFAAKAAAKRRQALAALAAEMGFDFDPAAGEPEAPHRLFAPFTRGHSRRMLNTMRGRSEIGGRPYPCTMGDFEYKVTHSNGKSTTTTTHRFSYILLRLPCPGTPGLTIRQEHLLDKIAGAVGFDDIDFESERFSRRFFVKSTDKKFAYDVVHPAMMEWLLANPGAVLLDSGWCCATDGSGPWEPPEFRRQLAWLRGFFGLWPDFVLQDLETRAGMSPTVGPGGR
jgi:hypothetical protein